METTFTVVIVGASMFGRQVALYAEDCGIQVRGFLDDDPGVRRPDGYQLLGSIGNHTVDGPFSAIIAVSEPTSRRRIAARLTERNIPLRSLIHPMAYVAEDAQIGAGCLIAPLSHIGAGTRIGKNVLINSNTLIGHNAQVGDHCALMHACINGGSSLGDGVMVGSFASVNPNVTVGAWSKIAAGSIVYEDMRTEVLISGNPAKAFPLMRSPQ